MLIIGKEYYLGWNTAKGMGCEDLYGNYVRCEAFGADWAVFRDRNGEACTTTFEDLEGFLNSMGD